MVNESRTRNSRRTLLGMAWPWLRYGRIYVNSGHTRALLNAEMPFLVRKSNNDEHLNWFHAIITTTITHMHRHFALHNSYSCRIRCVSSTPIAHKPAGVAGATAVQASSVITRTISNVNAGAASNYTYINASSVYCVYCISIAHSANALFAQIIIIICALCAVPCTTVHMIQHIYVYVLEHCSQQSGSSSSSIRFICIHSAKRSDNQLFYFIRIRPWCLFASSYLAECSHPGSFMCES